MLIQPMSQQACSRRYGDAAPGVADIIRDFEFVRQASRAPRAHARITSAVGAYSFVQAWRDHDRQGPKATPSRTTGNRLQRLRLLWIRASHGCESAVSLAIAEEYFAVEVCSTIGSAQAAGQRFAPQVVCWEFEDSHAAELRAMRDFKIANPSLPVLMLTTQHSEALAVWAFRARVWNYLIKPAATNELRANFSTLAQLVRDDNGPSRSVRCVGALLPGEVASNLNAVPVRSLQAAVRQVEQHYAEKLRQAAVAATCGMSSCGFSRAFKAEYGMTFSDYLMRFRIGRACRLLRHGSHSATTAGLAVGFEDASHFARAFRKLLGISPSLYQREKGALRTVKERRRRPRAIPGKGALRLGRGSRSMSPAQRVAMQLEQAHDASNDAGA
jgi:AraC-like DNA-binding protein/ActR/RegA family two-component response regulator